MKFRLAYNGSELNIFCCLFKLHCGLMVNLPLLDISGISAYSRPQTRPNRYIHSEMRTE